MTVTSTFPSDLRQSLENKRSFCDQQLHRWCSFLVYTANPLMINDSIVVGDTVIKPLSTLADANTRMDVNINLSKIDKCNDLVVKSLRVWHMYLMINFIILLQKITELRKFI